MQRRMTPPCVPTPIRTYMHLHAAKGGRGRGKGRPMVADDPNEVFQPVMCSACGTEVGVLDSDEVYHFFDVFPNVY
jgi:hypothetical protein